MGYLSLADLTPIIIVIHCISIFTPQWCKYKNLYCGLFIVCHLSNVSNISFSQGIHLYICIYSNYYLLYVKNFNIFLNNPNFALLYLNTVYFLFLDNFTIVKGTMTASGILLLFGFIVSVTSLISNFKSYLLTIYCFLVITLLSCILTFIARISFTVTFNAYFFIGQKSYFAFPYSLSILSSLLQFIGFLINFHSMFLMSPSFPPPPPSPSPSPGTTKHESSNKKELVTLDIHNSINKPRSNLATYQQYSATYA